MRDRYVPIERNHGKKHLFCKKDELEESNKFIRVHVGRFTSYSLETRLSDIRDSRIGGYTFWGVSLPHHFHN